MAVIRWAEARRGDGLVVSLGRSAMRGIGLARAIVVGAVLLMLLTVRRGAFNREFYRTRYSFSRLV